MSHTRAFSVKDTILFNGILVLVGLKRGFIYFVQWMGVFFLLHFRAAATTTALAQLRRSLEVFLQIYDQYHTICEHLTANFPKFRK